MSSRHKKIIGITAVALAGMVILLGIAGIWISRSARFQDYVRQRIVQSVQESTGGRVEIGSFQFDWRHLRVEIQQFVLHGTEPADQDPLFSARSITVELKLLSLARRRTVDIASLDVREPRAHLIVDAQGQTNIPQPKLPRSGDESALETLVDLAIGRFSIEGGSIRFADQAIPLSAQGENLSAHLSYEMAPGRYRAQITMNPVLTQYAGNARTSLTLALGAVLGKDRIELSEATFSTPHSTFKMSGSLDSLKTPRITAKGAGRIDLLEMKQILGTSFPISIPSGSPHVMDASFEGGMDNQQVRLSSANLTLGSSSLQASGTSRNIQLEDGSIQFRVQLALAEIGHILNPALRASGELELGGQARLNGLSDYHIDAALAASSVAIHQGNVHLSNLRASSKILADPHRIGLNPLTIQMGNGQVNGSATLEDFARYRAKVILNRLEIEPLIASTTSRRVAYSGAVSGPIELAGDLKHENSLTSVARLTIAPGKTGVPVSGAIAVDYSGPRDTVSLQNSYIALPSSRIDFAGELGKQIEIHLASRNLEDFKPALNLMANPPAALPVQVEPGGIARIDARIAGQIRAPAFVGHVAVTRFRVDQRRFDELAADLTGSSQRLTVDSATVRRDSLVAAIRGTLGLDHWTVKPASSLIVNASMQNGDVKDVLAFAGQSTLPLSGNFSFDARISGTVGDPQGQANLRMIQGVAYSEPLDLAEGQIVYGGQSITIPSMRMESGDARANLTATFEHPPERFSEGSIRAHVDTNQFALARLQPFQKQLSGLDGDVQVNLDTQLALQPASGNPEVRVVSVNGTAEGRNLRRQGRMLGNATARLQTSGTILGFRLVSNFAGSSVEADGQTNLARNYETSANVNIQNLPIQDALAVAGRGDIAASGLFSAKGKISGTLTDPQANLDVAVTRAVLFRQPVDRLEGQVAYTNRMIGLEDARIQIGASRIDLSGSFAHPQDDLSSGDLNVRVQSGQVQLAQIVYAQEWKPGIAGALQLSMNAAGKLNSPGAATRASFSTLNANLSLSQIRAGGRDFGSLTARVEGSGSTINADLESSLAQSVIHADVRTALTGDYPSTGQLTFSGVHYANWAGLVDTQAGPPAFDTLLEGKATFAGPLLTPENLTGNAELTKAELFAITSPTSRARVSKQPSKDLALTNDGPVSISADRSGIQVKRARWTGPSTQLSITGNATYRPLALNLSLNADADLALVHRMFDDISSEGHVAVNASVKGPIKEPALTGKVELSNAAFQTSDMPNGISKANGVILLSGTVATVQSLTAESGGGKIAIDGTVSRFGGQLAYNLGMRATRVQIRTASGASAGVNADLKLDGTQRAGVLSGNVTIRSVGFKPRSDLGTILAETADPPPTPAIPGGFLSGTRLDLAIRTVPGASFQSVYTTSLDASADLTMRGTLANPGMLGRVTISSGDLVFFGTKYSLESGSISFFNPTKIDPILDLNLATTARGVQVTLNVTGPVRDMNLAYQSDPPLQFSEIVGLLAAGRMPTSDPVLLARQPAIPPQSFQQMGESALLNKVVTNPVSGQLKRVFGVTELKIDPSFTSGSELPQARLTLQQNVTNHLSFTYITNLSSADSQILRAEWALNQRWSAVATRQENGLVGVDLFYKRRIH